LAIVVLYLLVFGLGFFYLMRAIGRLPAQTPGADETTAGRREVRDVDA
jgi:hypothetical protein